jgi:DNA-binding NarL/FixJ family response regulator
LVDGASRAILAAVENGGRRDTRVLLADLPGPGRAALATLIADVSGVALVGEAGDSESLDVLTRETLPDLVIVDDRLLEAAPEPPPRTIAVGADDDPGFAARAERLGAIGWVRKDLADVLLPPLLNPTDT